ncbi:pentapeptide repeat-containing protein [Methylocystis parvus]|nr:pentapeptide repeat-containing protein [Methylocystis parvus]WBJ98812.1 pentapeptide repeat-containing protein [Methylocystis parvus OBBP]
MISEELRKARLSRARAFTEGTSPADEQIAAIAKKADDLDAALKSVSEAAAIGAPLWLSYIFLLFYIAIAAGAVTHKELLLETPVELPFLNIKLPLKAFFLLAPALFVIVHGYVMAHFAMLAGKAKAFADLLRLKVPGDTPADHAIRDALRRQLPINIFAQFLVGPSDIRKGGFSLLLWIIAWATLVAGPVLLQLLLQLQFLPYHAPLVTLWHRCVLMLDLVLIWWLWKLIIAGRDAGGPKVENTLCRARDRFLWFARYAVAVPLTAATVFFSVFVATFPGEWEEEPTAQEEPSDGSKSPGERQTALCNFMLLVRPWVLPGTEIVFGKFDALADNGQGAETPALFGGWPMNRLSLQRFDIYAGLGAKGPDDFKWKPYTFDLSKRRLEQADLRFARLDNIDLRLAQLKGAGFNEAGLVKAKLMLTHLEGASLSSAQLQNADLRGAHLQGAALDLAHLQSANLSATDLQGANISAARLEGASLAIADLRGASLLGTYLTGADLNQVHLQGALLAYAELKGASLVRAELQGASLESAQLQGASLESAKLQGASLSGAYLWRTDFGEARFDEPKPIRFDRGNWTPSFFRNFQETPWTTSAYADLRKEIEELPKGEARDAALKRISRLDCKAAVDEHKIALASCDSGASPPERVTAWRIRLERAAVDDTTYAEDASKRVRKLICEGDKNAIYILRGLLSGGNFDATGSNAPALIGNILGRKMLRKKSCSVSKELTDTDRVRLNEMRARALKKFSPALPPRSINEATISRQLSPGR